MSITSVAAKPALGPLQLDEQARIRATLGKVAIFKDLSPSIVDDISRRVTVRRSPGGTAILAQDTAGDALYIIMAGRVKVVMSGESGREVTLAVLRSADIF